MSIAAKLRPEYLTFTGVDDATPHGEMDALAREYPIEWGILFHPTEQGTGRYPSLSKVAALLASELRFSAHLCGQHARSVTAGKPLPGDVVTILQRFGRIQVNTNERGLEPERIAKFAGRFGARGIVQCRGLEKFPADRHVDWLFDTSGGRGLLPDRWPVPSADSSFVGYSGGIGPDTVVAVLEGIAREHPPLLPFWLDMEGGIRSDDRLDLAKCREVCELVFARES